MIEVKNVSKKYELGEENFFALQDINLTIEDGEFVAIVGMSGSGKTTLLNLIGTLDNSSDGELIIDGSIISKMTNNELAKFRKEKLGFIFQSFNLEPEYTVFENIELPLILLGNYGKSNVGIIKQAASDVDLSDKLKCKVKNLSGGEQQRVAIARALVKRPTILLADEPCGNLDSANSKRIMDILDRLNSQGITVILVTHDSNDSQFASRIITLLDGKVLSDKKNILAS